MNIRCCLGIHSWNGCRCSRCGAIRDKGHDWSKNCERCRTCSKARPNHHKWTGCKCSTCGILRNAEHHWEGCRCSTCGIKRDEGHRLEHCFCTICGKLRHTWDGCKCLSCGETRTTDHRWRNCKCEICGTNRGTDHSWENCKCSTCGSTRDSDHLWEGCRCRLCGTSRDAEHRIVACRCTICESVRHTWRNGTCKECGEEHPILSDPEKKRGLCEQLENPLDFDWTYFEPSTSKESRDALGSLISLPDTDDEVISALRAAVFFEECWGSQYSVLSSIKRVAAIGAQSVMASLMSCPYPNAQDLKWLKRFQAKFQAVETRWRNAENSSAAATARRNLAPVSFNFDNDSWLRRHVEGIVSRLSDGGCVFAMLKCRECGHVQAKEAWATEMEKTARLAGMNWQNLSAIPQCLNCQSTNLVPQR
jgi:hypothetical protein